MVREGEGEEEGIVEQQRPSFVQDFKEAGLVNACEKQWHRTVTHMNAYPYVWASYFVVYGFFLLLPRCHPSSGISSFS
jgi:hypothetical protein